MLGQIAKLDHFRSGCGVDYVTTICDDINNEMQFNRSTHELIVVNGNDIITDLTNVK